MTDFETIFTDNKDRFIEEWIDLLRFKSVSTDPSHNDDCANCAQWLVDHLSQIGLKANLLETHSKPVVFAERKGDPNKPTVLVYGHYDVQPIDPIELWDSPPFEPEMRNDRLYARGAQDNKGQLFFVIKAIETLINEKADIPTIKVIIEGEEESGSEAISIGLPEWKNSLQADILMVTDTSTVSTGAPTIIMGLRGIVHFTAILRGPNHDLHSGTHGGLAPNPAAAMARLAASIHNDDGSIAVKGFYDSVKKPTAKELELANTIPFDSAEYINNTGITATAGEKQFSEAERIGFRPSIEVNGIQSGYSGAGTKTIIPSEAILKISSRLVPGQDPEESLNLITEHLENNKPDGFQLEIKDKGACGPGFRLDPDSSLAIKAAAVLDKLTKHKTAFLWEGASIPIVSELSKTANAEPLLVGFGSEKDNIHAPNESFSIQQFKLGFLYSANMIASL